MIIFEDDEPKTLQQSEEDGGQVLLFSFRQKARPDPCSARNQLEIHTDDELKKLEMPSPVCYV
jgi:hypothetical protein